MIISYEPPLTRPDIDRILVGKEPVQSKRTVRAGGKKQWT